MTLLDSALVVAVSQIQRDLNRLEDQVSENQDKIDATVAAINEAVGNVVAEVAALKDAVANGTPLDFTGLDAAVQGLDASTDVVESTEVPAPPVV